MSGAELIPAATVIPLRQSPTSVEVLLLKRNSRGQFGNMWVFPGGRVDSIDTGAVVGNGADVEMEAARVAAVPKRLKRPRSTLIPLNSFPSHSGFPRLAPRSGFQRGSF